MSSYFSIQCCGVVINSFVMQLFWLVWHLVRPQTMPQTGQRVWRALQTPAPSDGEDELGALALVDNMLTAMQHRQNTMKLRCFSGFFLHMQRCRLMSQMSEQMELQHQMKTAQKVLFEWHRRFKNRQQRINRLRIADGYFSYRLISQTFSAWHGFKQSVA